ncbi:NYN domain-containing protein [Patescibacteria group bacterium]|nr:NYN domain-containing protein [Patescibacteria group bacterium]MBU4082886.1 NYN domain-containing protein [Patescibacteria group bacterium]
MNIKKEERVVVYIDGNNFYKYLRNKEIDFPKGVKFNFIKFVDFLAGKRKLISKRYYIGIARNIDGSDKSKVIVSGQQKFLSKIENEGFAIKRGRVMYDGGRIREKGTDVKIAVDLIVGAVDDIYDTVILVSSDTDLIPAMNYVRYKGKKVEYVGFSHAPSLGMQKHVDFSVLLRPDDIDKFKSE